MSNQARGPVAEISPRDLRDRLEAGEPITLLDVREPDERAFATIPAPAPAGDLYIPMRDVPGRQDEVREALARGPVVVYCHHGVRSMHVAGWLAERGMTGLVNLEGGVDAWSLEVDPGVPRYS